MTDTTEKLHDHNKAGWSPAAGVSLNANNSSEFLAQCTQYRLDPVTALRELSIDHPLVLTFLRLGVAQAEHEIKRNARRLVKLGRADEINDPLLRAELTAWAERSEQIKDDYARNLVSGLGEIMRQYENTLYAKWVVNGTPLGATTPELLLAAAHHEEIIADGHLKNASFYRALADMGKPGVPLMMSVSVEDADRLRSTIFGGRAISKDN